MKYHNVFILLLCFLLSNSLVFGLQTYYILNEIFEKSLYISLTYTFLTFCIQILDSGAVIIIPRDQNADIFVSTRDYHFHFVLVRSVVWVVLCLLTYITVMLLKVVPSLTIYVIMLYPVVLNLAGFIEMQDKSGVNGLFNALPIIIAASAEFISINYFDDISLFSAAFIIGVWTSIILQNILYWRIIEGDIKITEKKFKFVMVSCFWQQLIMLPGQILFRSQMFLISSLAESNVAAIFAYIRQLINAFSQVALFTRRVVYLKIIKVVREKPVRFWENIAYVNFLTLFYLLISSLIGLGFYFVIDNSDFASIGGASLTIFSGVLLVWTTSIWGVVTLTYQARNSLPRIIICNYLITFFSLSCGYVISLYTYVAMLLLTEAIVQIVFIIYATKSYPNHLRSE